MDKIEKLLTEYEYFKEEMITRRTSKEVYEEYYKIHFYEELVIVLNCLNNIPDTNEYKKEMIENIGDLNLDGLFNEFICLEYGKLGTTDDIEDFLRSLAKRETEYE